MDRSRSSHWSSVPAAIGPGHRACHPLGSENDRPDRLRTSSCNEPASLTRRQRWSPKPNTSCSLNCEAGGIHSKQPTQTYEYVPKTTWVPQTQQIAKPVLTQNWVPKQQKIVVYQPVQTTEVRQQLVQTELPQPPGTVPTSIASTPRQPFFRLPDSRSATRASLADKLGRAAPIPAQYPAANAPSTQLAQSTAIPPAGPQANVRRCTSSADAKLSSYATPRTRRTAYVSAACTNAVRRGTRFYRHRNTHRAAFAQSSRPHRSFPSPASPRVPYAAPLQTVTTSQTASARDSLQAGMQATVLR